jgi:acetyl esterase/lipase
VVRSFLVGVVGTFLFGGVGFGQVVAAPVAAGVGNGGKTILLWPDGAPGAQGNEDIDKPALTVFVSPGANVTQTAVVVAPGGGYQHLSWAKEGTDFAQWLNARGVTAFVLQYRLGPKYHYPVELEDGQRAIRWVRAHAAEYGVAPDHVGMMGFSAGGHLAATVGTHFDGGNAASADVVERQGSKPDFLVLVYPVITFEAPYAHGGSKKYLLGEDPDPKLVDLLSDETQVTKDTPPTFLFATTDDQTVPVMNSVLFYSALVQSGVSAEMHLFQNGAHGAGLAVANPDLSVWPDLLAKWMRERGYMAAPK